MRPQQGVPGAQPMTPAGSRPPVPTGVSMPDGKMQYHQQKTGASSMENSSVSPLGNGQLNSFDSKTQEEAETENKVKILLLLFFF